MSTPTPGPWHWIADEGGSGTLYGTNADHVRCLPNTIIARAPLKVPHWTEEHNAERQANADLIAAAPDLYAALDAADCPVWVHNAAITNDIEALRKIALWYSNWNNNTRIAAMEKAGKVWE